MMTLTEKRSQLSINPPNTHYCPVAAGEVQSWKKNINN